MDFFKILRFLEKGNKTMFDYPVSEQKQFIESLGEPRDLLDRSYKQYRCQMYLVPRWKRVFQSVVAALVFPMLLFYYLMRGLLIRYIRSVLAVSDFSTMIEVVPDVLVEEFHPDNSVWDEDLALKPSDLSFIIALVFRFCLHPFFVMKISIKIALYRSLISRYAPQAIIVHNEYSFTSSALTAYCRKYGLLHIDVMHGEKLYYMRDSFFCYDRCYVWDAHYSELFTRLMAEPSQFVVAVPPSLCINLNDYHNSKAYADVKYYLGASREESIACIIESMRPFKEAGMTVKYRLHPRYSDRTVLLRYCTEEEIEDPQKVSIQASISNMSYAAGSYTTVLLQAALAGKPVILDDVTYKNTYDQLKEMDYILINKPHFRLSNISEICS